MVDEVDACMHDAATPVHGRCGAVSGGQPRLVAAKQQEIRRQVGPG